MTTPRDTRLDQFEAALAASESATVVLTNWCRTHGIGSEAFIRARPLNSAPVDPSDAMRALLGVGADEPVGYRHVSLECGDTVLSIAQNWYVPARLTPRMNEVLETSQEPFGPVVQPLGFSRERLDAMRGPADGCPAGTVLSHRARLRLEDGTPISLLVECYTGAIVPQD